MYATKRLLEKVGVAPQWFFSVILLIFVISRFFSIFSFPIFNDEAIYIGYSDLISGDFQKFAYISVGNIFHDWKPPLQYWLGSFFVPIGNPLIATRILSVLFSIGGLLGLYSFSKRLFGQPTALLSALLYTLSAPVLMYNTQFVAETFVFSTTAILYALVLAMYESRERTEQAVYWCLCAIFASALILFKQSGILPLFLLPLLAFAKKGTNKEVVGRLILVGTLIPAAKAVYHLLIPYRYFFDASFYLSRWTLDIKEIAELPIQLWEENIKTISSFYSYYYGWVTVLLICFFFIQAIRKKSGTDLALGSLFLIASAVIIFGLRQFNEYIYHTAVIIFLVPLLARGLLFFFENWDKDMPLLRQPLALAGMILGGFLLGIWGYKFALVEFRPIRYLELGTPWMVSNYLTNWSTGYGVDEVVRFLREEVHASAIVFADAQVGNPGTALVDYQRYYPNIQIMLIWSNLTDYLTPDFLSKYERRFFIFSDWPNAENTLSHDWQPDVEKNYCKSRKEFRGYPTQIPIVVCEF